MKKKLLSALLAGVMMLSLLPTSLYTIALTAGTPTLISSTEDLKAISESGYYILTADIDLSGENWVPLPEFSGTLDGGNHIIRNLSITDSDGEDNGLFASIGNTGSVYNLGMEGVNTTAGNNTGAIAGTNNGTIRRCYTTGTVKGDERVGGIVGINTGTIENCYSRVAVSGNSYLGGLVGNNSGTITTSYAASAVTTSVMNNYLKFNSDGYVNIPNNDNYQTDAFTLEAWFQVDSTELAFIVSKSAANNTEWFEIHTNGNGLRFIPIPNGNISKDPNAYSGDSWIDVKDVLQEGWFHVAAVYWYDSEAKEAHAQIYVNGEAKELWQKPSQDADAVNVGETATIKRTTNPLKDANNMESISIGRRGDASYYFNGKIADVRFWNTARTGEDILSEKDRMLMGTETGLVGYWKLNDDLGDSVIEGALVADSTANQNQGTIHGTVTQTKESADVNKGALVGSSTGMVENCFYDSTLFNLGENGAGTAKTTAEMKTQSTYTDWDYGTIWKIEDNDYPNLGFKTVSSVTVTPNTISVEKGKTQQFTATVTGTNSPAQTVTWSVEGGAAETSINSDGVLTIAADETATTITVRATSTDDTAKSGTVTLTVTVTPPVVEPYRSLQLGTGGINSPVNSGGTTAYHYVYFGNNDEPIKWRVLDAAKGNAVGGTDSLSDGTNPVANSDAMFLLMENLYDNLKSAYASGIPRGAFRMIPYSYNTGGLQTLRPAMTAMTDNTSYFTALEQAYMLQTSMSDDEYRVLASGEQTLTNSYEDNNILAGDKLFPLSLKEAHSGSYFINGNADRIAKCESNEGVWWLRSCSLTVLNAIKIATSGIFDTSGGSNDYKVEYYMRPAFNLNRLAVLFTSAAEGGKSAAGMDSGLTALPQAHLQSGS